MSPPQWNFACNFTLEKDILKGVISIYFLKGLKEHTVLILLLQYSKDWSIRFALLFFRFPVNFNYSLAVSAWVSLGITIPMKFRIIYKAVLFSFFMWTYMYIKLLIEKVLKMRICYLGYWTLTLYKTYSISVWLCLRLLDNETIYIFFQRNMLLTFFFLLSQLQSLNM